MEILIVLALLGLIGILVGVASLTFVGAASHNAMVDVHLSQSRLYPAGTDGDDAVRALPAREIRRDDSVTQDRHATEVVPPHPHWSAAGYISNSHNDDALRAYALDPQYN